MGKNLGLSIVLIFALANCARKAPPLNLSGVNVNPSNTPSCTNFQLTRVGSGAVAVGQQVAWQVTASGCASQLTLRRQDVADITFVGSTGFLKTYSQPSVSYREQVWINNQEVVSTEFAIISPNSNSGQGQTLLECQLVTLNNPVRLVATGPTQIAPTRANLRLMVSQPAVLQELISLSQSQAPVLNGVSLSALIQQSVEFGAFLSVPATHIISAKIADPSGVLPPNYCFTSVEVLPPAAPISQNITQFLAKVGLFRQGIWTSPGLPGAATFGNGEDIPFFGDFDANGAWQMGIFRPNTGTFVIDDEDRVLSTVDRSGQFGGSSDFPVIGDWDGNGRDQIGVFRKTTGEFFLDSNADFVWSGAGDAQGVFGQVNDLPFAGDFNGDGLSEVGVFRGGQFLIDANRNLTYDPGADLVFNYGMAGDTPIIGDWNDDDRSDIGVFRSAEGRFILDTNLNHILDANDISWVADGYVDHKPFAIGYRIPKINPLTPPSCELTATATTITRGENASLVLNSVLGGPALSAMVGDVSAGISSATNVSIRQMTAGNQVITATVSGPGGTGSCSTTITVRPARPACTITASTYTVVRGSPVTLTLTATNANVPGGAALLLSEVTEMGINGVRAFTPSLAPQTASVTPSNNVAYTAYVKSYSGEIIGCTASVITVTGRWFSANGQNCTSFCAARGLSHTADRTGLRCASGEIRPLDYVAQVNSFPYGTWGSGNATIGSSFVVNDDDENYCYHAGQEQDGDDSDKVVGCFCQ